MTRFWIIVAGLCIVAAALALWLGHLDLAFVSATIGLMAWFLNYRTRIKEVTAARSRFHDHPEPGQSDEDS